MNYYKTKFNISTSFYFIFPLIFVAVVAFN